MQFLQDGPTRVFEPNDANGMATGWGLENIDTNLALLADGSLALSYRATGAGIVEMFDPDTGVETANNLLFGGDADDKITLSAWGSTGFAVAFEENQSTTSSDNSIFLSRHLPNGTQLGGADEYNVLFSQFFPRDPLLEETSNGFVLIANTGSFDLGLRFFGASGAQIGVEQDFDDSQGDTPGEPLAVATLSNGQTVVMDTFEPQLFTANTGWEMTFFDPATGRRTDDPLLVQPAPPPGFPSTGNQFNVIDAAANPGGGFSVVYQVENLNAGRNALFITQFNNDGSRVGNGLLDRSLNLEGDKSFGDVNLFMLDDGGFALIYSGSGDGRDVYGALFDENAQRIGKVQVLNDVTAGAQRGLDAVQLDDGRIAVSYLDKPGGEVRVQIFDLTTEVVAEDILGTTGDDPDLRGTFYDDVIRGLQGNDRIYALLGDDVVYGNAGRDTIFAGDGNDRVFGGGGNDRLEGGEGADLLNGGAGRDMASYEIASTGLRADLGVADRNTGEAAGDTYVRIENLMGSGFRDILSGTSQGNWISGLGGNDTLEGRGGADTLRGDAGADRLDGGNGNDWLIGGSGVDRLIGGAGDDLLRGGGGRDVFVFGEGHDVIEDFDRDRLLIDSTLWSGLATRAQVLARAKVVGDDTVITFDAANSLTLQGVTDIDGLRQFIDIA